MEEGSFYCYVPSGHQVPSWLPFRKGSEKAVIKHLGSLQDRQDGGVLSPTNVGRSPWNSKRSLSSTSDHDNENQTLVPGAGVIAQYGWVEVAGELYRVQPVVHNTKDAIIVMYGYLYDIEALQPSCWGHSTPDGKGGSHNKHSFDFSDMRAEVHSLSAESGSMPAQILLQHLLFVTRNEGSLAEAMENVKGCYAFVAYDSEKRVAYAARDESGEETLFYFVDAEGCLHFSNLPIDIPEYPNTATKWKELPLGSHMRIKPPSSKSKAPKVEVVRRGLSRSAAPIPAPLLPSPKSVNPGIPDPLWQQGPQQQQQHDSSSNSDAEEPNEEGTLFSLE
mmetsp:Transcript_33237/g.94167  ORF Transcript_33237/g.94167 Transcript_33237/m.94167 type:complete len:334 (-) Transcript_33237:107-1108(-)|eukprot:CAMPEP_0117693494 /NCGR_PEP_ID=MMETSP0804-20121206/26908_1 /TAXON_ID=1074897 /ORGANISM="Tetraselmis astigmatica, Strain CCMP880" /LENGTH=333 /DNA_ID=CAMNT_0005507047 /DNA_START=728 /DNA_END=1729 /DNA_ORIENTATION=+